MPINKKTNYGDIKITDNAIASLAGSTVCECYGVVGVISKSYVVDSYLAILKKENYSKGIVISRKNNDLIIDIYVVVSFGVKISEVVLEVQKRVKYTIEKSLNVDVKEVNVHVERIKEN
ncbi:MAG: Asp23/Gls24 family envelope stress response protein [Erysipelotrichaceae bacterium]|nr:Asp23/Gls24 family envelope stress response protein [Erysipelotrichaceae bacterium]